MSAFDITSVWKSSILTQLSGKTGAPPAVAYLRTQSTPTLQLQSAWTL
ncbi:hypothetical protein [Pseudomonas aeruginosa]